MSGAGIEAVIARSRRPGGFSERKTFSVARKRGIQKLRRFALADPHYYILELIQAAVANRATYIDIQVDARRCTFAYVGGGLAEHELAQLFDFLFASKDRTDIGHIRELALGVNAVMLFEPSRITIESGDGTLEGTTKMVVSSDHDSVEVGKPDRPLGGTYVSIEGMQRGKLPEGFDRWRNQERPRECGVVEERCLAAPIPILVNNIPLFGMSSQRTPGLFGYRKVVAFDEGDLYGAIGYRPSFPNPSFRLLTWGVAIQSKAHDLMPGHRLGGVICFDRLHKNVDHSGIVEDERLQEMWIRLRPYAEELVTGKARSSIYALRRLDGELLAPDELRELLRCEEVVVLVPETAEPHSPQGRRAIQIGRSLEATVLRGTPDQTPVMRALGGAKLRIIRPSLQTDDDVRFYAKAPADEPARPWLIPPVEVPNLPLAELYDALRQASGARDIGLRLEDLGGRDEAHAWVYTPRSVATQDALAVEVRTTERTVFSGRLPSPWLGHVLVVELPDARVASLLAPLDEGPQAPAVVEEIARITARHAATTLASAFSRAVMSLADSSIEPGSAAAMLGLAAAARSVLPRLRGDGARARLGLSQLEAREIDLLALPLLRTVDGATVDLATVAQWTEQTHGLVYGTIPSVAPDLQGLDCSKILALTEAEERMLVTLIGESSYVRIDARDVLAAHDGVLCRDLALGLRGYPSFPLLVEGRDPTELDEAQQRACELELVGQLVRRFVGLHPPRPEDPKALADWQECRRQACRHLQWYVCHQGSRASAVLDLPLFLDAAEEPRSFRELWTAMQGSEGLALYHGHAHAPAALGHLAEAAAQGWRPPADRSTPTTLVGTPFLHRCLMQVGADRVRPAFDFDLSGDGRRGAEVPVYLAEATVDASGLRGQLGVPAEPPVDPDIVVLLPDDSRLRAMSELAREHGVTGWVRLDADEQWTDERLVEVASVVRQSAETALQGLIDELPSVTDVAERERRLEVLFGYVQRHLVLHGQQTDRVVPHAPTELVHRILSLPLFESRWGGPMPGWRLVRRCCGLLVQGETNPASVLFEELCSSSSPALRAFVTTTLHPSRVVRAPSSGRHIDAPTYEPIRQGEVDDMTLQSTLTHWLRVLRPDPHPGPPSRVFVVEPTDNEGNVSTAGDAVFINRHGWLAQWARKAGTVDPQALGFCLLTAYAALNEALERVTDEHELQFQRRIAEAITAGRLVMLPPMPMPTEPAPVTVSAQ